MPVSILPLVFETPACYEKAIPCLDAGCDGSCDEYGGRGCPRSRSDHEPEHSLQVSPEGRPLHWGIKAPREVAFTEEAQPGDWDFDRF